MDDDVRKAQRDAASALALSRQTNARVDELMTDLGGLVTQAVERAIANQPGIREEEREFLALAVKAQAQRVKLRQAIIEKTVPSLVWASLLGLYFFVKHMVEEYLKAKGWNIPWK